MNKENILYNTIGNGYNDTRQPDKYILSKLNEWLDPKEGCLYLDIGCGTGNYTIEIAAQKYDFVGVDPSKKMLEIAKKKSQNINWLTGTAEEIPTESKIFDGIIGTLTIHHWTNLRKAFAELYRVMKVDAKIVLFTSTPEQMKRYWLNQYFPLMMENSITQMPTFESIKAAAIDAGFRNIFCEKYFVMDNLSDLFLYAGKNRPELYLNEAVRNGISSFANLALKEEVENGLQNLEYDIKQNRIKDLINKYENTEGDYLFIIIEK